MADEHDLSSPAIRCGWLSFPGTDRTICGMPVHSAYIIQVREPTDEAPEWQNATPKSVVLCLCEQHAQIHPGGLLEDMGYTLIRRGRARELLDIERKYNAL